MIIRTLHIIGVFGNSRLLKHSFINTVDAEEYIDDKLKELKNG